MLSRTQLIWRKFLRNKVGVGGGLVTVALLLMIALGDFLRPYPIDQHNYDSINSPPQRVRVFGAGGLDRPYMLHHEQSLHPETLSEIYTPTGRRIYLQLLVHGDPYRLLGFIPSACTCSGPPTAARSTCSGPTASGAICCRASSAGCACR